MNETIQNDFITLNSQVFALDASESIDLFTKNIYLICPVTLIPLSISLK